MPNSHFPHRSGALATLAFATLAGSLLSSPAWASATAPKCLLDAPELAPLSSYQVIETRANTFTKNLQDEASVAVDARGNLLNVWSSRRQEAGTYGIFAQRFDPLGRPLGTEIHVNQFMPGAQYRPAVASDAQGNAWIVWQSLGQDGSRAGIYMRRFGQVGGEFAPLGDEILVNTTVAGDQFRPNVSVNTRGQALVAWSSLTDSGHTRLVGRFFAADGSSMGGELQLSSSVQDGWNRLPSIDDLPGGDFVVAWAHRNDAEQPSAIQARLVSPAEGLNGKIVQITDAQDTREQIEPSLGADAQGNLVCAWMRSRNAGNGWDVLAGRLGADLQPKGDICVVREHASDWLSGVAVAVAPSGEFAVAYNLHGQKQVGSRAHRPVTPATVWAQLYDSSGRRQGEALRVNQDDMGQHTLSASSAATRALWSDLGQLVFAWNGNRDEDRSAVALTLFAPPTLQVPAPPAVAPLAAAATVSGADVRATPDFNPDWVPQAAKLDFDAAGPDFGFTAFQTTAWQPPDPDCAAGPNHIVSVVNMDIRVHTKDGTLISSQLLEDFFAGQSGGDFLFDPVALYDHHVDRFVIATADHQGSQDGLNIAITKTSDPTDGWHKYYFNTDSIGDYIDFENLGMGSEAYYVTADYFGSYRNVIHIFEKAPMLSGSPFSIRSKTTANTLLSLGSVKSYDADPPAQYFATSWASSSAIRLYALRNPLGTPILTQFDVSVPYFTSPPDATQKGSSNRVSTIDERIKNGVYRNGSLWLTHSVGESSTARVRWYEIEMNGWPLSEANPVLVQNGTLDYGSGEHNWFPDITVSDDGDAVITCSRSSLNDYPYIARAGRKFYDADDSFRHSVRLKESNGPMTGSRWGDYSGNDEDPADPGVVWSHTIYNTTGDSWNTWVGRIDTDQLMVLDDPGVLQRGTMETLTIQGARANGTVFVAYSFAGPGSTYVPQLDATLDLANPKKAGSAVAAADGSVTFQAYVPAGAPAGPIYLQIVERNDTSNVIATSLN